MRDFFGFIFGAVVFVGIFLGIMWAFEGNTFFLYQYFAPKFEQVRRNTFEQSKAYNQGMIQEIQNMQFQYEQADDAHKGALADIILHRTADYDTEKMPSDTRQFVEKLRHERTTQR